MKKLLLLFTLTIVSYTNAQITSFDNLPISRVLVLDTNNYPSEEESITIPSGKLWYINGVHTSVSAGSSLLRFSRGAIKSEGFQTSIFIGHIYPAGSKIWSPSNMTAFILNIIEYDLDAQSVASTDTNLKLDNKMQLFPNPTNSRLSLNSEKDYNIEVFDLSGRKIMEAQGNNLDMSNLSKATYIVKAFDKASKETYSYKVIRN